jgi:hypothetical protein
LMLVNKKVSKLACVWVCGIYNRLKMFSFIWQRSVLTYPCIISNVVTFKNPKMTPVRCQVLKFGGAPKILGNAHLAIFSPVRWGPRKLGCWIWSGKGVGIRSGFFRTWPAFLSRFGGWSHPFINHPWGWTLGVRVLVRELVIFECYP